MKEFNAEIQMNDSLVRLNGGSVLQHGSLNNRIYLMKLMEEDFPHILSYLDDLAYTNSYTKIFCKVPVWAVPEMKSKGYFIEAQIPNFFNNKVSAFFMSKILNSDRLRNIENGRLQDLGKLLTDPVISNSEPISLPSGYRMVHLKKEHTDQMARVYKQVFKSYPFPIFDPGYLIETMKDNVQYFGVEWKDQLVAISSAEIDREGQNAEMTDFATLNDFRGKKLSVLLLQTMEQSLADQDIKTFYTIARLNSIPMNKTFIKLGYSYAGTLLMNTNIAGKIESMNVLYKPAVSVHA